MYDLSRWNLKREIWWNLKQNRQLGNLGNFHFFNKSISWPLSFCLGKFFVVFTSKLQLLWKFEVKKKVSILGIGQILLSHSVLFHAQFTKFSTSLKIHVPPLRHAALFLSISWNLKSVTSWWALALKEGLFIYMYI